MANSKAVLDLVLKTPALVKAVPHLQPEVLHRIIQTCGLEDCSELVALATPAQLAHVVDADVWHAPTPGADDEFDVNRFGVWLDVLMQCGAPIAAQKLMSLEIDLVIAGFSRHTAVFDRAAVTSFMTLSGEEMGGRQPTGAATIEIGSYLIEARQMSAWDTIVELLAYLSADHSGYFDRLMRGCVQLSDGAREADGFHTLLEEPEQDLFDLATDRNARREPQGYVSPADARAFLAASRRVQFDGQQPPLHPLARAYFREIAPLEAPDNRIGDGLLPEATTGTPAIEPAAIAAVMDILLEAGVLAAEPRALLPSVAQEQPRLRLIQNYIATHADSPAQLAYLANALLAGCSIQGRPLTTQEASDGAAAVCNLGLERWPHHWRGQDLITVFQVGWTTLYREVVLFAASRLVDVLAGLKSPERDVQLRVIGLRRQLTRDIGDGAPWRARRALDVIALLDGVSLSALLALIDECPVLNGAVTTGRDPSRTIDPSAFEFISQGSDIGIVRQFMASLATQLSA